MKTILSLITILVSLAGFSQLINSNQSTIGEFYDGKVKTIEINGAKVSGQLRLPPYNFTNSYAFKNHSEVKSAVKNNSFFFNFGLTNTNSTILNLSKFDFKKNNGFTAGFTFQHAFSEIYLAKNPSIHNPHTLQSYLISFDYKQEKFENFDPLNTQITTARPEIVTLRGAYSFYFFRHRDNAKFKYSLIPTVNGKVNLKDYNATKLTNYIRTDNIETNDNIAFTANTTFDGKYGTVHNDLTTAQIALSIPFVTDKFCKILPVLSPIPYLCYDFFENDKPRFNGGIALGFLNSSIIGDIIQDTDGNSFRKFNVPSYFSIGVDWNYQNGIGSKPNYYIAGSIKIQ